MEEGHEVPQWLVPSADEVFERVEQANSMENPDSPMAAFDIEQLFTNIEQKDLKAKMHKLFDMLWQMMCDERKKTINTRSGRDGMTPDKIHLVIYAKKLKKDPEWKTTAEVGKTRNSPNKRIVSLAELKEWVTLAVDHSYCKVGEELKKQSMGIPMGMNASPFLSNLYLFMYELIFMKQFMGDRDSRKFFRDNFMCCVRFQDDRWVLAGKYEKKAMYSNIKWGEDGETTKPWNGIYPGEYLKVTEEGEASYDITTHQDLNIMRTAGKPSKDGTMSYYYYTDVYDRKFDKKFDKVRPYMVMYQQPDTQLADQCIYGVVFCEMVRFSKRCSREEDFVAATTRMTGEMIAMGYNARKIKSKVYKFAAEIPHLFYRNGAKAWSRNIIGLIDDQRPRTPTREAMMEGVGLSEEQWGAALRLYMLQDITEEDKRRATVQ